MLDFFFRHYDPWVERYVFFDDGSTDGTRERIAAHPRAEWRPFVRSVADSYVLSAQRVQNEAWKESRGAADWVVVTAVDEHLHHPQGHRYLRRCHEAGVTLIPALGYQMVAEAFPDPGLLLCRALPSGAPYQPMSKLSLFRPDAVEETNFAVGRHEAAPTGRLRLPERDELLLLHYKYLGRERARTRNATLASGLGARDRANSWGWQYSRDAASFDAEFDEFVRLARDTTSPLLFPWKRHWGRRWWRRGAEGRGGLAWPLPRTPRAEPERPRITAEA